MNNARIESVREGGEYPGTGVGLGQLFCRNFYAGIN